MTPEKIMKIFFFLFLLVSIPLLLLNLGTVPFIEDEGIRGLVALEMGHSGNLFTPTLYGEYYFKKPPLWNWILLLSYNIFGRADEFTSRVPTLVFILVYTLSIYYVYRQYVTERVAALTALFFLTCGRILFWDSMLGLIDICFSWVTFMLFIWIFHFQSKQRYIALYLGAYLITAVAFMLKGLPALVFVGFTLLATHAYYGDWKRLLSWQHFLGIGTLAACLGAYLLIFSQYQPLETLFSTLIDESTQRTAIKHGLWSAFLQLFIFPLEMLYHFLPWSVMTLLFFHRNVRVMLKENRFLAFTSVVFIANIWIYWSSPEVYPRYLFMFVPLYFGLAIHIYFTERPGTFTKMVDWMLIGLGVLVTIGSVALFFNKATSEISGLWWRWGSSAILMTTILLFMIRKREYRLEAFCVFLLAARLGFSLIILPVRGSDSTGAESRLDAQRVAMKVQQDELWIYDHDNMRYEVGFYLTAATGRPIATTDKVLEDAYLLVNRAKYSTLRDQFQVIDSIRVRRDPDHVYLIKRSTN